MALNLDAIRRKMAELSGERRNSQFWYPEVGSYVVRALPWPDGKTSEGTPFVERYFYYIGGGKPVLAPKQFGDEDPVNELSRSLWSSGKAEDKEAAKKLMPRMKAYLPVLVKGEEDKGIQLWAFNKEVYNRLLELMLKEDIGDYTDLNDGFNLEVSIKNTDRKFNGKVMTSTTIDASRRSSPVVAWFNNDKDKMKEAMQKLPDVDAIYPRRSAVEIQRILDAWVNAGNETPSDDAGTSRGPAVADALEQLASELPTTRHVDEKPVVKKRKVEVETDDVPVTSGKTKKSLDDAFKDLIDDE